MWDLDLFTLEVYLEMIVLYSSLLTSKVCQKGQSIVRQHAQVSLKHLNIQLHLRIAISISSHVNERCFIVFKGFREVLI